MIRYSYLCIDYYKSLNTKTFFFLAKVKLPSLPSNISPLPLSQEKKVTLVHPGPSANAGP